MAFRPLSPTYLVSILLLSFRPLPSRIVYYTVIIYLSSGFFARTIIHPGFRTPASGPRALRAGMGGFSSQSVTPFAGVRGYSPGQFAGVPRGPSVDHERDRNWEFMGTLSAPRWPSSVSRVQFSHSAIIFFFPLLRALPSLLMGLRDGDVVL